MNKQIEQVLDSREVAEMVGKEHKELLRDIRRYVEQITESNLALSKSGSDSWLKIETSDFFKENTYKDSTGRTLPCYNATKKGCEFIANKLTGVKGTEFTARFINRFHEMEDIIQTGILQKQDSSKRLPLPSVNMMVKNITGALEKAKVEPIYIAAEIKRLYTDAGYPVNAPLITDKATMSKLYDNTEMARELGVLSTNGNPHSQAIGAIVKKLHIPESEIVKTAFSRNGHDDVTTQYKPSVFEDVKLWLAENGYPTRITYIDSKGNQKTCTVVYQEVA